MKVELARKFNSSESKFCIKHYGAGFGKPNLPEIPGNDEHNISAFAGKILSLITNHNSVNFHSTETLHISKYAE